MTVELLPSAPVMLVAWAKANADLSAIQGTRVGTRLNATLPASRIQRVGGSPTDFYADEPVMQIEAWAADEAAADLLARTWVKALESVRHETAAGRIYTYRIESGPYWFPDDPNLSNNARYILTVRLVTTA